MNRGLTIRNKGLILTLVPLIFVTVFVVAVVETQRWNQQDEARLLQCKASLAQVHLVARTLVDTSVEVASSLVPGSSTNDERYSKAATAVSQGISALQQLSASDPVLNFLDEHLSQDVSSEMNLYGRVLALSRSGQRNEAAALLQGDRARGLSQAISKDLRAFEDQLGDQDAVRMAQLARSWERIYWLLIIGVGLHILLTAGLSLFFSSGVNMRLHYLMLKAQRLAEGKDVGPALGGTDEIACLENVFQEMADALLVAARRERAVIEHAMDIICSLDVNGVFVRVSPASRKLWGYCPEDLVGRSMHEIVAPSDMVRTDRMLHGVIGGQPVIDFENECIHREGATITMAWSACWSESEKLVFCVAHDVTERKRAEVRIWHQAHHDSLTGLPNRMLFHDRLNQALSQARRSQQMIAVLFLDLDRFKRINDSLGHSAGDEVLKEVASRLTAVVRKSDTVARMGGDEFIILLTDLAQGADAGAVAEKIASRLRQPWVRGEHEVEITASIGIAIYPHDGQDADVLLQHADAAQYRTKALQRGDYQYFNAAIDIPTEDRLSLEGSIQHATERGEMDVYYQPLLATGCDQIVGVEALARWKSARFGSIPPSTFIPIAEESRVILQIDRWVMSRACAQMVYWQKMGLPPIGVSVNVSVRHFHNGSLVVNMVRDVLAETGLDPALLELDVPDIAAADSALHCETTFQQLQNLGVSICIDNFGTGYSSIGFLKGLSFNTLKVDRTLIQDVTENEQSRAIVTSMVSLARSLGRRVIAEGVEDSEQLSFLRSILCDAYQGFLFSQPVPAREIEAMIKVTQACA
jgi:diguanylate cyclase (GGDEF)-like protein/PAS domain S-box-containing protein